jgi:hypothetical protein
MDDQKINSDKHYDLEFYRPAKVKIIEEYYPLIGELASEFNSLDDLIKVYIIFDN